MQRTAARLRPDPASRLADLERRTPEWRTWTRLLREVLRALDDPAWGSPLADAAEPGVAGAGTPEAPLLECRTLRAATGSATPGAPLLEGRSLRVDTGRLRRLVRRLAETSAARGAAEAASLGTYRPSGDDALRLLEAAVRSDPARLAELAEAAEVHRAPLETMAQLAAVPVLHSCGRLLADGVALSWAHGQCPICGGWPVLAELRGLGGARRLRCGRCGGDWRVDWLCCTYCGERNHEELGSLASEGRRETLRVETCNRCRGYLKSVATLQAIPPFELLLWDLETVELDLVALERGYSRPQGSGVPLDVRVMPRSPRVLG